MFIQTEDTPNPNTLKFIPGVPVLSSGTIDFASKSKAKRSHLASVTKQDELNWETLKPLILTSIMDHYASGKKIVENNLVEDTNIYNDEKDSEVVKQIKELIDQRVRPAVAMDGGDITFCSFENGIVTLQMKGACAGCPSSTATLKMGIENMLRHYIPEVVEVKAAEL